MYLSVLFMGSLYIYHKCYTYVIHDAGPFYLKERKRCTFTVKIAKIYWRMVYDLFEVIYRL